MYILLATVFVFLFLLGFVGTLYPTGLHRKMKLDNRVKNLVVCLGAFILFAVVVINSPEPEPITLNWQDKVKEIAASDKTKREKQDAVMRFAKEYRPDKEELAEFEQSIMSEYKIGKYLADPENHEYMLGNIFKAAVINEQYDDKDQVPIDEFAFDFWQNTKYVYRGVDSLDSPSVKSNEEQMNKALEKME